MQFLLNSLESFKGKKNEDKLEAHYSGMAVLWYSDKMEYNDKMKDLDLWDKCKRISAPVTLPSSSLCLWPHPELPTII